MCVGNLLHLGLGWVGLGCFRIQGCVLIRKQEKLLSVCTYLSNSEAFNLVISLRIVSNPAVSYECEQQYH